MDQLGSTGTGNRRFALGTVAGVVVGGLLIVGALQLVQPRAANTAVPSTAQTTGTAPTSAAPAGGGSTATPTQAQSAAPTSAATPATGTWFAMVRWMDKSSYSLSDALAYADGWSNQTTPVVVIDTDVVKLRGGKTGQWAVGVVGLASMNEATAACRVMGLTPGTRCGRFEVV